MAIAIASLVLKVAGSSLRIHSLRPFLTAATQVAAPLIVTSPQSGTHGYPLAVPAGTPCYYGVFAVLGGQRPAPRRSFDLHGTGGHPRLQYRHNSSPVRHPLEAGTWGQSQSGHPNGVPTYRIRDNKRPKFGSFWDRGTRVTVEVELLESFWRK